MERAREVGVEVHEETTVVGVLRGEGKDEDRVCGVRYVPKRDHSEHTTGRFS